MGVEYELKFRATPEQQDRLQADISGEQLQYRMETTYYDTPSGALSARWWTLRCRKENAASVCTLKLPAQGQGRQEYEVESPDIATALPELCRLCPAPELPLLLRQGLQPVCGARFTRLAKTLVLPDCTVELALDRGVLTGGGRELPLCEVEVELKSGDREAARHYAQTLAQSYGLQPEPLSKFRRAALLAEGKGV